MVQKNLLNQLFVVEVKSAIFISKPNFELLYIIIIKIRLKFAYSGNTILKNSNHIKIKVNLK